MRRRPMFFAYENSPKYEPLPHSLSPSFSVPHVHQVFTYLYFRAFCLDLTAPLPLLDGLSAFFSAPSIPVMPQSRWHLARQSHLQFSSPLPPTHPFPIPNMTLFQFPHMFHKFYRISLIFLWFSSRLRLVSLIKHFSPICIGFQHTQE